MAVLAGQDVRPGGTADGIGAEGILEEHALPGDAIDVRGGGDLVEEATWVSRDGIAGMVVRKHEDDVGLLAGGRSGQCAESEAEKMGEDAIHGRLEAEQSRARQTSPAHCYAADDSPALDRCFGAAALGCSPLLLDSCEGEAEGFGFRTGHGVIEESNVLVALSSFCRSVWT